MVCAKFQIRRRTSAECPAFTEMFGHDEWSDDYAVLADFQLSMWFPLDPSMAEKDII